jgi:hypothetical protein
MRSREAGRSQGGLGRVAVNGEIGAGVPETGDRDGAFPRLSDDQRARLRKLGRLRTVEADEVLLPPATPARTMPMTDAFVLGCRSQRMPMSSAPIRGLKGNKTMTTKGMPKR